jgi:hypothetical protein
MPVDPGLGDEYPNGFQVGFDSIRIGALVVSFRSRQRITEGMLPDAPKVRDRLSM